MNFNATMYSDGKLWALPDWPETPGYCNIKSITCGENFYDCKSNGCKAESARAASIKGRVEFKEQAESIKILCDSLKSGLNWGNSKVELKEGEVYPKPEGYRIGLKREPVPCPDGIEGCEVLHTKEFALLLPIREEPTVTLPNVKNDPLYQDLNRLPAIHEQINKTSKEIWEDQPAKPSPEIACIATDEALPTRKLVLDELIEWIDRFKVKNPHVDPHYFIKKIEEKAQSLRKKEEENIKHGMSYTFHDPNDPANQKFVDIFFTQTYKTQ